MSTGTVYQRFFGSLLGGRRSGSAPTDAVGKPHATRAARQRQGFVDSLDPAGARGWAMRPDGSPSITVRVNGKEFAPPVEWFDRPDVAQAFGPHALHTGFWVDLSGVLTPGLLEALEGPLSLDILADGMPLAPSAGATIRLPGNPVEPLALAAVEGDVTARLTAWRPFVLMGHAANGTGAPVRIEVLRDGTPFDCPVLRLADAVSGGAPGARFQIELPGHIWEGAADEARITLSVLANGVAISEGLAPLTRAKCVEWVSALFSDVAVPMSGHSGLLALEHIRHARIARLLPPASLKAAVDFASQHGLADYIPLAGTKLPAPTAPPAVEIEAALLDRAVRHLNGEIARGDRGAVIDLVRATLRRFHLGKWAAHELVVTAIPMLCHRGEFGRLRELPEFHGLERLVLANDTWRRTLAIAYLASSRRYEEASQLLEQIGRDLTGWPNTECLRYAIERAMADRTSGLITQQVFDKTCYAFITFLDGFKGGWFSRLHDANLIAAMAAVLRDCDYYPDWLTRDLGLAALRHYGINPSFWELHARSASGDRLATFADHLLWAARRHFGVLAALAGPDRTRAVQEVEPVRSALRFFHRHANADTAPFLREIITRLLAAPAHPSTDILLDALIEQLLSIDPGEVVRIAAFPSPKIRSLLASRPDLVQLTPEQLRMLSPRAKSPVFHVQRTAGEALSALRRAAIDGGSRDRASGVEQLVAAGQALSGWRGQFLGPDLLISGYEAVPATSAEAQSLLAAALTALREAADTTDPKFFAPAPALAALSRLAALGASDPLARGLHADIRARLASRFADRHDGALAPVEAPLMPVDEGGWPHDTLVVVYSCRKHLETRVAAIRETWLGDLKARRIPWVIVVGDGDGTLEGDVLALPVSDLYDDLPLKTLAMLEWVHRHTNAQYVVKVDDDCYLDVGRYFDSLSYRKFHYYGRVISRTPGSTDRLWHQPRSSSPRGRHGIDKSPEPSTFADGGGVYSLSRLAIDRLLARRGTLAGQRLLASSFLEDKLVGDLLAADGIAPSDEDYHGYVRRRPAPDAAAVSAHDSSFFNGPLTPVQCVHLDETVSRQHLAAMAETTALTPSKIWPACWPVKIGLNSNSLELITPPERLALLDRDGPVVVAVMRNEMVMLPHFLAHYRRLGTACFLIADNLSTDGTQQALVGEPDVIAYSVDTEYRASHYGVTWQQALLSNHCLGKWVVIADADELLVYDDSETRPLPDLIAEIEAEGANACYTLMIDMYPYGGLATADLTRAGPFEAAPYFDNPPLGSWNFSTGTFGNTVHMVSALRHRLVTDCHPTDFTAQKVALLKYAPWIRLSEGIHCVANVRIARRPAFFAHFKYHAAFERKVREEVARKQHYNAAAEYKKYANLLAESAGSFGTDGLSARFRSSRDFTSLAALPLGGSRPLGRA